MPCVLGLIPAGSFSSVHGRGCCKKRHPNIESLKQSLRKTAADFPVDILHNSIGGWPQRLKDCVRVNGGHQWRPVPCLDGCSQNTKNEPIEIFFNRANFKAKIKTLNKHLYTKLISIK